MHSEEFLKLVRYFFKKTSGQLLICPIESPVPGVNEEESWDIEQVTNDVKSMKIKARACKNFEEAFELQKKQLMNDMALSWSPVLTQLLIPTGAQKVSRNSKHPMYPFLALCIGCGIGYGYGLSAFKTSKSPFFFLNSSLHTHTTYSNSRLLSVALGHNCLYTFRWKFSGNGMDYTSFI